MNPLRILFPVVILALLCSCEVYQEEKEVVCLPVNMTATIVEGSEASKIIADFHYLPDSDLLDHITWSNHQTHYFEYETTGQLSVVRQLKVKEKVQEETWFEYQGALATRVVLVKKNLDYTFLEPVDSIYVGYIDFEYEGKNIIKETRYDVSDETGADFMVRMVDYEYDTEGNIINSTALYPERGGEVETVEMTYDASKHPFSGLSYYFTGESFVNNLLSRSSEIDNLDYQYEFRLNSFGYPETVFETLGSSNSRIIRYSYLCL